MFTATVGLFAGVVLARPIASGLNLDGQPNLVRAAFIGVWARR